MNRNRFTIVFRACMRLVLVCISAAILYGCSSGSDDLTASGGIGGTGVNIGDVSDYGSIFVNGMELDTNQADIFVEGAYVGTGDQVVREHLPIGQRVVVQGDISGDSHGNALQVEAFYRVRGPLWAINAIDDNTFALNIMGQTVYVNQETTFHGVSSASLTPDMVLQAAGPVDGEGAVHSGLIALQDDDGNPIGLKGPIQALNRQQHTFRINALFVDYSQADAPQALLTEGRAVAVQGHLSGETLLAISVQSFATNAFSSADHFIVDGFITGAITANQWQMGDYRLQFGGGTMFEGMLPEDLTAGIHIQVRGRLQNRVLQATRIALMSRVRLESNVADVDEPNGELTLEGMMPLTVHITALTRIHGNAATLGDIAPGDHVRIYGTAIDDAAFSGILFKAFNPAQDDRWILQGPVSSIASPQFTILGVTLDTTANEGIDFYDADGHQVTADQFLSALNAAAVVRVIGQWEANQLMYREMAVIR